MTAAGSARRFLIPKDHQKSNNESISKDHWFNNNNASISKDHRFNNNNISSKAIVSIDHDDSSRKSLSVSKDHRNQLLISIDHQPLYNNNNNSHTGIAQESVKNQQKMNRVPPSDLTAVRWMTLCLNNQSFQGNLPTSSNSLITVLPKCSNSWPNGLRNSKAVDTTGMTVGT